MKMLILSIHILNNREYFVNIQELKKKSEESLILFAESLEIKKANTLNKQEIVFAILKKQVEQGVSNSGGGTLEILQEGFGDDARLT